MDDKIERLKNEILALTVRELGELNRRIREDPGEGDAGVREPRWPKPSGSSDLISPRRVDPGW